MPKREQNHFSYRLALLSVVAVGLVVFEGETSAGAQSNSSLQFPVSVRANNGASIPSQIKVTVDGESKTYTLDDDGRMNPQSFDCPEGAVVDVDPMIMGSIEEALPSDCERLSFTFKPHGTYVAVTEVETFEAVPLTQLAARDPDLARSLKMYEDAIANYRVGDAASYSNDISAIFRAKGEEQEARYFSDIAIRLGTVSILSTNKLNLSDYGLTASLEEDDIGLGTEVSQKVLTVWQSQNGLTSGQWDKRTFTAITR